MPVPRGSFQERLLSWRFLFVVNLVIIVFLSLSLGREVVRNKTIQSEIHTLEQQVVALTGENSKIGELQSALQSESYIEREARLKLGMKKPGEQVVVIQDSESQMNGNSGPGSSTDPLGLVISDEEEIEKLANSSKWWYYFFDKSVFKTLQNYE